MSKIVVLNSGGFDSVVLAHEVKSTNPEAEIYNLFFNYGQLSLKSERKCSKACSDKLNFTFKEITIPEFNWSDSVLCGGSNDNQYIPLRNLVFLSYALSYAEAIGAKKVYCAFINPEGEYYNDTSPTFLKKVNNLSALFGIKVLAPYITQLKGVHLKSLARKYSVKREDIHSCNYGDEPCGKCSDCEYLDEIFEDLSYKISDDILINNDFKITEEFIQSVKEGKIVSAKLYINNACQFSCKHCFLGKQKMVGTPLDIEEWNRVLRELSDLGVKYIDFFGKEPLINSKVFHLMEECQSLNMKTGLITNGVNVGMYIEELAYYKPTVAISVESLKKTKYRDKGDYIVDTLKLLIKRGVPVSVSIDLNDSNVGSLIPTVKKLARIGVTEFYIKPIRPFGESEHYLMDKLVSPKDIFKCIKRLNFLSILLGVRITMSFAMMDLQRLYEADHNQFNKYIGSLIQNRTDNLGGLIIDTELYCHRYRDNIAITPDGYVLGCASEYCTDYSNFPNVRDKSVQECVLEGKDSLCHESYNNVGCYFCKEYIKNNSQIFGK